MGRGGGEWAKGGKEGGLSGCGEEEEGGSVERGGVGWKGRERNG